MNQRIARAGGVVSVIITAVLFTACGGAEHDVNAVGPGGAGSDGGARSSESGAAGAPSAPFHGGGAAGASDGGESGNEAGAAGRASAAGVAPDGAAGAPGSEGGAAGAPNEVPSGLPYAQSIESFTPGNSAGYGQTRLPDVVLGPPSGNGVLSGGLDVLSLGVGGEIVLGFGDRSIVNGEGPDFVVFENPFWPSGDATMVFAEPGEVAVSEDGQTWRTFPCDPSRDSKFAGCAGVTPTERYDATQLPLDPRLSGGDAFDLEELSVERARFVRIRDRSASGAGTSAGFDLDAVGVVYLE